MIDNGLEQELLAHGEYMSTTVGRSMWPLLRNRRESVVIRAVNGDLGSGDVALYRQPHTNAYVLHRGLEVKEDCYIIAGDNCSVLERVPKSRVIGYMDGFYRGEKWIPPESRFLRAYARVSVAISPLRRRLVRLRERAWALGSRVKRKIFPKK